MKDLHNNVSPVQSIAPDAYTADVQGAAADLQHYESADIEINVGTWTDGTHTFEVQHRDDPADSWEAVPDGDLQGTEPVVEDANGDEQVYQVGYLGGLRYVRVVATVAGATSGANYGATVVRGHPRFMGNTLMDADD